MVMSSTRRRSTRRLSWDVDHGPVDVYRNLHLDLFSIRSRRTHRIIGHQREFLMDVAAFHVGASGRARVLASGQKNVHAWLTGTLVRDLDMLMDPPRGVYVPVRYTPQLGRFIDADTGEIARPGQYVLTAGRMYRLDDAS